MNILVINGSPKGQNSITWQTVNYLEKLHPEHSFVTIHAGQQIKKLERDFSPVIREMEKAELVLFSYPVYTFIAPYQLHRFIELLKESGVDVSGKFATQITTSKHFYDVTAHRYVQDNCCDLGLKYIRGLSADMDDLTVKKGQLEAQNWADHLFWCIKNNYYEPVTTLTVQHTPVMAKVPVVTKEKQGDVVIVTTATETDVSLNAMIDRFRAVLPAATRVVNLNDYPFSGGCLGCFNCAVDGKCIYKDGFDDFLRGQLQTAQAIIYAFAIKDHSMGSRFKLYDDRQFCNGHRTVTMGMPVGYLISGRYSHEANLQMILEGRAQVGGNILAGIATDEADTDNAVNMLAANLSYSLKYKNTQPANFYGVGGMKIFRDLIWQMQGMMKADHKFYKAHGQYDFPQKKPGRMIAMYRVGAMLANPKIKAKMGNNMNEGMLMPYKKVLDSIPDKKEKQ
ncbi:MAG: NAD(P)H-dependent oxidoreductase [Oscillospiraceae bacterium]|nr:NAD(P)H-dependent oxidoreductase [Oscillospiraceae bacterium]